MEPSLSILIFYYKLELFARIVSINIKFVVIPNFLHVLEAGI